MQFHLNGFEPGDPEIADPAERVCLGHAGSVPDEVDVLIVGRGPAGLTLRRSLRRFRHQDLHRRAEAEPAAARPGRRRRLPHHGDVHAYGFAERVLKEACWITETTFWKPDDGKAKTSSAAAVSGRRGRAVGIPHVILNQARVHDCYLDVMRKSPSKLEPYYSRRLLDRDFTAARFEDHAVTVSLERLDAGHEGEVETVRVRYVVAATGRAAWCANRSGASCAAIPPTMPGASWTCLPSPIFPTFASSADPVGQRRQRHRMPRERGYLVRLYVELTNLDAASGSPALHHVEI